MRLHYILIAFLVSILSYAQNTKETEDSTSSRNIRATETLDIIDQFDFLSNSSDSYRDYKVVKKDWINTVRKHLVDSLDQNKLILQTLHSDIDSQTKSIDSLQNKIQILETLNSKKDKINFLGLSFNKTFYHLILWSLIGLATILAFYFFYMHKRANKITKDTLLRYNELDKEFNDARTKALEREQSISRKLLDAEKKINELSKD